MREEYPAVRQACAIRPDMEGSGTKGYRNDSRSPFDEEILMTAPQDQAPEPHTDPQTHLDTDPADRDADDDTDEVSESEAGPQ